mgnify:FL=1
MNRISFLHLFNYLPKNIINLLIQIPYRIVGFVELIKKNYQINNRLFSVFVCFIRRTN